NQGMTTDKKPTKAEIKELEAQIKADQEKPVRENERRVRVGAAFQDAVKEMSQAPPMTNNEVAKWVKDQRKEIEDLENDR
ncbi:MAG: hypothetical protein WAS74_04215, partial [Candidatus Saccharimonas aalborgensis]